MGSTKYRGWRAGGEGGDPGLQGTACPPGLVSLGCVGLMLQMPGPLLQALPWSRGLLRPCGLRKEAEVGASVVAAEGVSGAKGGARALPGVQESKTFSGGSQEACPCPPASLARVDWRVCVQGAESWPGKRAEEAVS